MRGGTLRRFGPVGITLDTAAAIDHHTMTADGKFERCQPLIGQTRIDRICRHAHVHDQTFTALTKPLQACTRRTDVNIRLAAGAGQDTFDKFRIALLGAVE